LQDLDVFVQKWGCPTRGSVHSNLVGGEDVRCRAGMMPRLGKVVARMRRWIEDGVARRRLVTLWALSWDGSEVSFLKNPKGGGGLP